jgi:hypothetical protein
MPAKRVTNQQRLRVRERARGYCEYCRCPDYISHDPYSVDHIIPIVREGTSRLSNLAYACLGCNGEKRAQVMIVDPLTLKSVKLFNPRRQQWADHFGWNEDFTLAIGLTPTGRATVEALALNRPGIINLRRLLRRARKHPPQY